MRTQSLGVGDSGRFLAAPRGAPPRFRPPPPPDERQHNRQRRLDLFDTCSSDGEAEMFDAANVADFRSLDRKRLNQEVIGNFTPINSKDKSVCLFQIK